MNFPLSVSPSKEMEDRKSKRKRSLTSAGIETTTSRFDRPASDCSGNSGNVKDTVTLTVVSSPKGDAMLPGNDSAGNH